MTGVVGAAPAVRRRVEEVVPGWLDYLGPSGAARILVLAGLLGWMYWDHLARLYHYWLQPDWSHGFLIPLFTLYLVNLKRARLMSLPHRGSLWGAVAMVLSTFIYVAAIVAKVGYPQPLSIISMICGIVLLLCGWRTLWQTLFPIAFLALAMPPPDRIYRAVTQPLQQGAAALATFVLNALPGADVERDGINISCWVAGVGPRDFTVAGACSGMRSLMAFVALGLAMAYFTPRPAWHRVTMALAVVPVALLCNVIRVIVTGTFMMYGYGDLASGTPHMILGLLTFGLGFAIYFGVLWMLDHLFVEGEGPPGGAAREGA
jgi:exosortase